MRDEVNAVRRLFHPSSFRLHPFYESAWPAKRAVLAPET
jgi:hypothetical protein